MNGEKALLLSHEIDYINRTTPTIRNIKIQNQTYEIFMMREDRAIVNTIFKNPKRNFLVSPRDITETKTFPDDPRHSCEWQISIPE